MENEKIATDLPECWSDDVRMDVLFSPFRERKVNPENFEAKLKFWKDMLLRYCNHNGSPAFSIRDVKYSYQRKNKLPCGIEQVVDDLIANRELRLKVDFVSDPQNSWSGWLLNGLMKKPLQWSLQKFREKTDPGDMQYVHLGALKAQSKSLKPILAKHPGTVISFDKLANTEGLNLNKDGLYLNLLYLSGLQKVSLEYKVKNGQQRIHLVKIPEKGSLATPITEADRTVYVLEQTEEDLRKTLEDIESEVVKCNTLARECVRQGKRIVAKSHLRKKHKLEANLEKYSKALDNIQTLLASIHESKDNVDILDAYKIGSKTLKTLVLPSEINLDNIDDIVDDIKESLDLHEDVRQSMANIQPTDTAEDAELEQELSAILAAKDEPVMQPINDNRPTQPSAAPVKPELPQINLNPGHDVIVLKKTADDELFKHLEALEIESASILSTNTEPKVNLQ